MKQIDSNEYPLLFAEAAAEYKRNPTEVTKSILNGWEYESFVKVFEDVCYMEAYYKLGQTKSLHPNDNYLNLIKAIKNLWPEARIANKEEALLFNEAVAKLVQWNHKVNPTEEEFEKITQLSPQNEKVFIIISNELSVDIGPGTALSALLKRAFID